MWLIIRTFFSAIPTALSSLALGIASLGLGLENALPLHTLGQTIGAIIASIFLCAILLKFILHPGLLRKELKHPVLGSILPTFAMSLMLVAKTLAIWHLHAGEILWAGAVFLHVILMLIFTWHRVHALDLQLMVPSWFIPFVGIMLGAVTFPHPRFLPIAYTLWFFGVCCYAILLPVMVYRFMFIKEVTDAAKPTIAVMAAPASLSLAGYLLVEPDPSLLLCSILLGIALLMTCVIYVAFFKLLRLPFTPAFAAYTFPMAVGATALYKVAAKLQPYPEAAEYVLQLQIMAVGEMVIATLIVAYVCLRYILYYARSGGYINQIWHKCRQH